MWRAQEQCGGWLPEPALRYIADLLDMAYIRVYEIATFYTMFNLAPVGRYYVQLCGTTPCWLRGAEALKDTCRKLIGEPGHVPRMGCSPGPRSSASALASMRRWCRSTRTITRT